MSKSHLNISFHNAIYESTLSTEHQDLNMYMYIYLCVNGIFIHFGYKISSVGKILIK